MHKTSGSGDRKNRPISFLTASAEVILVSLPRPPCRWRIARRDFAGPQRDQMAPLVRIAPDFGALAAAHVTFEFMDRRCLRSPHDVEGNGLMCVAAKAFHFEIAVPRVERVAQRGRWLRRTLKAEHALVLRLDGEPVGFLAGVGRPWERT